MNIEDRDKKAFTILLFVIVIIVLLPFNLILYNSNLPTTSFLILNLRGVISKRTGQPEMMFDTFIII
jgi:hypothetical protein